MSPEVLKAGRKQLLKDRIDDNDRDNKTPQLKGKRKTEYWTKTVYNQNDDVLKMKGNEEGDDGIQIYINKQKQVHRMLINTTIKYKKQHIDRKV